MNGITILNGFTAYSEDYGFWLYYRNNRPKDITISFSDGAPVKYTLDDTYIDGEHFYQDIKFDSPRNTDYIKITIDSIYKGDRWNDTCISEIHPY